MSREPLIFDERKPYAHYERARELKGTADRAISFGKVFPFIALPIGVICAIFDPLAMALFTMFGAFFTALSVLGCSIRRAGLCLAGMPFAFAAALTLALSSSDLGVLGAPLYLIAGLSQIRAMSAIGDYNMLKELPGFPLFEHGLEDVSFAALEIRDAEGLPEDEPVPEEKGRAKYVPIGPPSEEMPELFTDGEMPELPVPKYEPETEEKSAYEKMANALPEGNGSVSDLDIFGL